MRLQSSEVQRLPDGHETEGDTEASMPYAHMRCADRSQMGAILFTLVDLIELPELDESFELRLKDYSSPLEDRLRVEDAILSLLPLFELAQERYPNLVKNVGRM